MIVSVVRSGMRQRGSEWRGWLVLAGALHLAAAAGAFSKVAPPGGWLVLAVALILAAAAAAISKLPQLGVGLAVAAAAAGAVALGLGTAVRTQLDQRVKAESASRVLTAGAPSRRVLVRDMSPSGA